MDTLTDKVFGKLYAAKGCILMNMPAAIGACCFFSIKLEVNFDFEIPEANGQLVLRQ